MKNIKHIYKIKIKSIKQLIIMYLIYSFKNELNLKMLNHQLKKKLNQLKIKNQLKIIQHLIIVIIKIIYSSNLKI